MRADIVPGGIFPGYELTDHTKTRRRLSDLQGIDPMILVLSCGGHSMHHPYQQAGRGQSPPAPGMPSDAAVPTGA